MKKWRPVFPDKAFWLLQEEGGKPLASVHRVSAKDWRGLFTNGSMAVGSHRSFEAARDTVHKLLGETYPVEGEEGT